MKIGQVLLAGGEPIGPLYLWPDSDRQRTPQSAIAGPFATQRAAQWALVSEIEARLDTDAKRTLWGEAAWMAGGPQSADVGQLLGIITLIATGRARDFVLACARPTLRRVEQTTLLPERPDLKLLAAGERSDR